MLDNDKDEKFADNGESDSTDENNETSSIDEEAERILTSRGADFFEVKDNDSAEIIPLKENMKPEKFKPHLFAGVALLIFGVAILVGVFILLLSYFQSKRAENVDLSDTGNIGTNVFPGNQDIHDHTDHEGREEVFEEANRVLQLLKNYSGDDFGAFFTGTPLKLKFKFSLFCQLLIFI